MYNPYDIIKSEKVYKGKIIDVVKDVIVLPDGKQAEREVVLHGNASAIIPIDKDGNIIFVKQYRHAVKSEVLEIPAGMFEDNEDPLLCAKRELEEETSFIAKNIKLIVKMYSSIGFCTEMLYIYLADELEQGKFNFDDDEFIAIEKYPLEKVIEMIHKGEILDSKTIVAVFAYNEMLSKKKEM